MRRQLVTLVVCLAMVGCGGNGGGSEPGNSSNSSPSPSPQNSPSTPASGSLQKAIFWRALSDSHRNLYLVNEDGTGMVALAESAGVHTYKATAANGRIVYETYYPNEQQTELYSVNADGTALANLTASQDRELFAGVTRANRVIYVREMTTGAPRDLYSVATDGTGRCAIATTQEDETFLAIAPDDRVIFGRCAGNSCSLHVGDCSTSVRLSDTVNLDELVGVTSSGRVAYTVRDDSINASRLYTVNADGSDRRELGLVDANTWAVPMIHSDSLIWGQSGRVVVASAQGGTATVLADTGTAAYHRAVTADGRLIYQVGGANRVTETNDVYSVRLDGTDRRLLAGTEVIEFFQRLTPSGRALYQRYASPGTSGPYELRSVRADGSGDVSIGSTTGVSAAEAVMPNGQVVYVHHEATGQHDHYAVNDDGGANRFLLSGGKYNAATSNDRVVFTTPCANPRIVDPPVRTACSNAWGDVISVRSDGTGVVSLASGSEDEGFEGLYQAAP